MRLRTLTVIAALLALTAFPALRTAHAQTQPPAAQGFSVQASAVDIATIAGPGNMTILLWGITPAQKPDTVEGIRARVYLDDLIGGRQVRCLAMAGTPAPGATVRARCLNGDQRDLSLQMIGAGLATVNRADVTGSELGPAYMAAERQSRIGQHGIWAPTAVGGGAAVAAPAIEDYGTISGLPVWAILFGLMGVPFLGFLFLGMIMHFGLRQLITLQRYQLAGTQKRERQLKEREKYVIASALEGEIMTNRAKLDAFLTIYEEMLKSLRDPAKTPKYQRAGDIVHEKPALTRTVFDAHIDKLDLLGPQLSSDLSNLYNLVVPNPDYKMLEPEVPITKAQELVDRIVRNAERLLEPMDKVAGALAVIVRDKRGTITATE